MGLLIKTSKPKAILANGRKLKKIMANGRQIWSGAVRITFVEGGSRTTIEYEEGTTVNRATAPSGCTFIGWSTSSSGANPQRTFRATQDMTVYRVVKYNDMTGTFYTNADGYVYLSNPTCYSQIHYWMSEAHGGTIWVATGVPPYNASDGYIQSNYGGVIVAGMNNGNAYVYNPSTPGYYLFRKNPAYNYLCTYTITGKTMVG